MRGLSVAIFLVGILSFACWVSAQTSVNKATDITYPIDGDVEGPNDLSAIGRVGEFYIVGSDESSRVEILRKEGDRFKAVRNIPLAAEGTEIDIESIACDGNTVYVAGSHSKTRSVKLAGGRAKNLAKLAVIKDNPNRDAIYRFTLDDEGKPGRIDKINLRPALEHDPILLPFTGLPCKENGIDIEGLAVHGGNLYAGFRGPVLRDGWTPIMRFSFDDPLGTAHTMFVPLAGRGVRDMTRVSDGFLIIAGPVGSGPGSFQLVHWDGNDCLPGKASDAKAGVVRLLTEIPMRDAGKPEGIFVLEETPTFYRLLLVYDGILNGGITEVRVDRR